MSTAVAAYIGLGSNLDDPAARIRDALERLAAAPGVDAIAASGLHGSRPMGPPDQPDFVNAVARLQTTLTAHALLDRCQAIERAAGRSRDGVRWGPRTLDLDLLLHGDQRIDDARLQVPHPGIAQRAFVLVPLAEIAPELVIPGHGRVGDLVGARDVSTVWPLAEDRA